MRQVLQEVLTNVPRRIADADGNPVNNPNYDQNKRGTGEVEIAVPLKHLGNFWNNLNILLINCVITSRGKKNIGSRFCQIEVILQKVQHLK